MCNLTPTLHIYIYIYKEKIGYVWSPTTKRKMKFILSQTIHMIYLVGGIISSSYSLLKTNFFPYIIDFHNNNPSFDYVKQQISKYILFTIN